MDDPGREGARARATAENYYEVDDHRRWTHVRLYILPDGGVARFRVHGEVVVDPRFLTTTVDLLAMENGGRLLDTSDAFYSSPANLILPNRARIMGEGWENARRRGDGNDWALFKLAARGVPTLVEVDTSYFIGNAPGWVRISAADEADRIARGRRHLVGRRPEDPRRSSTPGTASWSTSAREATHLRLDVYPDGGLARLRCFGEIDDAERKHLYARFFDGPARKHAVPGTIPSAHRALPPTRSEPSPRSTSAERTWAPRSVRSVAQPADHPGTPFVVTKRSRISAIDAWHR